MSLVINRGYVNKSQPAHSISIREGARHLHDITCHTYVWLFAQGFGVFGGVTLRLWVSSAW